MKFNFTETKEIEFDIDFQKIYGYDIEDNEYNESTMDIIYKEWGNWIQTSLDVIDSD